MTQLLIDRATLEQLVESLEAVLDDSKYANELTVTGGVYEGLQCKEALTAGRAALAQQELPQKERPDFMAGYDAGMADAKRMAQQGEPVAQARLGMKDGLAMALSVVELYGMKGDVIYREIAKLRDGIAAAPAPQAQPAQGEVTRRKIFVCAHCDGIYADQTVTQCDCMEGTGADFVEGFAEYPAALQSAQPIGINGMVEATTRPAIDAAIKQGHQHE